MIKRRRNRPTHAVTAEARAWKKWNRDERDKRMPGLVPEQILTWLDQTRELMIEVWRKNPSLRSRFEKLRG